MVEKNNKKSILKLQRTVRFFEALLRASADGIVITDAAKNIIFVNDTFCKYFSCNRQDVIETSMLVWLETFFLNANVRWKELENQTTRNGIARDVEFWMKTEGQRRHFTVNSSLLEQVDIEEAGLIISIWRDDTERMLAKEELQRAHDELEVRVKERTAELAESEGKYRRLFEYSNDIIVHVDKFGKVLTVNNKLTEVFGLSPEEVIGKYFFNLGVLGMKDLPWILKLFRNSIRKGITKDKSGRFLDKIELDLRAKNGNLISVETSTTFLQKDGKIDGFLTTIRDVTQRKQADLEYKTILNTTMDGFYLMDGSGRFIEANEAYCHLIGYSNEELSNMRVSDIEALETPQETSDHIKRVKDVGFDRFETRQRNKAGRIIDVEVCVNYQKNIGGRLFVFLRDITQRKQMEVDLEAGKNFIESVFFAIQDGISVLDMNFVHIDVNEALCRMTGFTREELIGTGPPHPYWPEESLGEVGKAFRKTLAGQICEYELIFKRKNGERFPVIVAPSNVCDNKGRIVSYCAIIKDITQRKQVDEKLNQQLQELKRWHEVTINREGRVLELKQEVNKLLKRLHEPASYSENYKEFNNHATKRCEEKKESRGRDI